MKWRLVNIPEVLFFQEGPGVRKWQFTDSGVKLLNVGNLNDNQLNLSTTSIYISNEEAFGKYSHFLVEEGDLLIGCSGIVVDKFHQKMAFAQKSDLPLCMNTSTMRFRCLDERLDIRFFMYVLQSKIFTNQLRKLITGSAQLNFGPSHIKQIQIPLPPLPVQQKIAAILDAADAYRQKTKALIEKYDQLAQSLFLEMFGDPVRNEKGWEVKAGEEYCSEITVGVVIKPASYYVEEGVVALRSLNIKPNAFDLSNLVYFSKESHSTQLKKSILNESDIVIVRTGNTGTAAVIPESLSNSNCIDLIIVRPNKMIVNPKYITYLINSKPGKKLVSGKEVGGIQKHFNIGSFKKLLLPIPPKEIQDQFVESINIIDQQRLKLEISMIKSEELFQSLLQKAFNGDLVS